MIYSRSKQGTYYFIRYATAQCVDQGARLMLAAIHMPRLNSCRIRAQASRSGPAGRRGHQVGSAGPRILCHGHNEGARGHECQIPYAVQEHRHGSRRLGRVCRRQARQNICRQHVMSFRKDSLMDLVDFLPSCQNVHDNKVATAGLFHMTCAIRP